MAANDILINIGAKDRASAQLRKVSRNTSTMAKNFNRLGNRITSSMSRAGQSVATVGRNMGIASVAMGAGVGYAVTAFARFDSRMAEVKAKTEGTDQSMLRLRERAKELGKTTRFSATEASEAMAVLAQSGFDTNEIFKGIAPTLDLASAGGVEMAQAAQVGSDVLRGFGMEASQFTQVVDIIAKTATSSSTNVEAMGETFTYLATQANLSRQSLSETAAAMGLAANRGIRGSMAGTNLSIVLRRLADGDVQKQISELGVEALDAEGNIRPVISVLQELGQATAGMQSSKQLALFGDLFEARGARVAGAIAKATAEDVNKMRQSMADAGGAAKRMAETMEDSVMGSFVQVKSAFEAVQISIGEGLKPALISLSASLTTFLRGTASFLESHPGIVKAVAGLALGFGGLTAGIISAGAGIRLMAFALPPLIKAFGLATKLVLGFKMVIAGIAFIASPLGIAIAAVAAAAAGIAYVFTKAAQKAGIFKRVIGELKKSFTFLLDTAKQVFGGIVGFLKYGRWGDAAKVAMLGLKIAFYEGLRLIMLGFSKFYGAMKGLLMNFFSSAMEATKQFAVTMIEALKKPFQASDTIRDGIRNIYRIWEKEGSTGLANFFASQRDQAKKELDELTKVFANQTPPADWLEQEGGGGAGGEGGGLAGAVMGANHKKASLAVKSINTSESRLLTRGSGGNKMDRLLKAAEATAKNTAKVARHADDDSPGANWVQSEQAAAVELTWMK